MYAVDQFAIDNGRSGLELMEAAGAGVTDAIVKRWAPRPTAILCGPGNNGGDGWVVARRLREAGWPVTIFSLVKRQALKGDAASMAAEWEFDYRSISGFDWSNFDLVVDAMFGAGLSRSLEGEAAVIAEQSWHQNEAQIVAVDVPSGMDGCAEQSSGPFVKATMTVTFHRFKPAHVLEPFRTHCGEVELVDIGIPKGWDNNVPVEAAVNSPLDWRVPNVRDAAAIHKHSRGRVFVRAGPAGTTGAARLAGSAALVSGAGFVTLHCPDAGALAEVVTDDRTLVAKLDPDYDLAARMPSGAVAVLGPGAGSSDGFKSEVLGVAERGGPAVLDADALSSFQGNTERLFEVLSPNIVLTPHDGEFKRLFPDIQAPSKIERARQAAERCGAVVLLKGPDTVIAAPDRDVRVNIHSSPRLATAGTGDLLAGLIGALMAQGMSGFDAACAGAWIHGEAGLRCGPGATVETVLQKLPAAIAQVERLQQRCAAQQRVYAADG